MKWLIIGGQVAVLAAVAAGMTAFAAARSGDASDAVDAGSAVEHQHASGNAGASAAEAVDDASPPTTATSATHAGHASPAPPGPAVGSGQPGDDETPSDAAPEHQHGPAPDSVANKNPHNHPEPTPAELACLAEVTAKAKSLTQRFEDFDAAIAEGYREPAKEGGTHYANPPYHRDDAIFDFAHPETVIYRARPDGTKKLLGVMYTAPIGRGPSPCGNATWWHTHPKCIETATRTIIDAPPDGECGEGTLFREGRVEMLHLWFVPRRELH